MGATASPHQRAPIRLDWWRPRQLPSVRKPRVRQHRRNRHRPGRGHRV